MLSTTQVQNERLFLNSVPSAYTRNLYKIYLQKYLDICGYKDTTELLSRGHKQIEREIIEIIIRFKERGMKCAAITNYVKPVVSLRNINDIMVNTKKISKFMPPLVRSKKTFGYSHDHIQRLLDIADERMRAVILLLCSTGCTIGFLPIANVGNTEEVMRKDLNKITVYENEPEEYTVFCTSECKAKGIDPYLQIRERYGEVIPESSPLVREQFDRTDQFAIAHPRRIKETAIARKLTELAEAAGLRTRVQLKEGQKAASVRNEIPVCNGYRRFFCGQLANSGLQTEKRWLLEGHNLKANDASYLKVTPDDLLAQYELAHDNLLISQENRLMRKVEKLEVGKTQFERLAAQIAAKEQKINK